MNLRIISMGVLFLACVGCAGGSIPDKTAASAPTGITSSPTLPTKCCVPPGSPHLELLTAPDSGPPGTTVRIHVTGCNDPSGENHAISFNDDAMNPAARNDPNTVRAVPDVQHGATLTARYTISKGDATGGEGIFFVQCGQTLRQTTFHVTT